MYEVLISEIKRASFEIKGNRMLILILILILHFIKRFGISQIEDQSKKLWEIISKCESGQG